MFDHGGNRDELSDPVLSPVGGPGRWHDDDADL
jgi:hypothetical protein